MKDESKIMSDSVKIENHNKNILDKFTSLSFNQKVISIFSIVGLFSFFVLDFKKVAFWWWTKVYNLWLESAFLFLWFFLILLLQYLFLIEKKDLLSNAKSKIFSLIISSFFSGYFVLLYIFSNIIPTRKDFFLLWYYVISISFLVILYFSFLEIYNSFKLKENKNK